MEPNLRQTTRECVYLRRCCHFRSRDKDGVTPFDPTYSKTSTMIVNFTALSSIEPELLQIKVLHSGNMYRDFRAFLLL